MPFLILLAPLREVLSAPELLALFHGLIIWSGVIPLVLLARQRLKNEALVALIAIAYLSNALTGTIVNHGFHPEAVYIPSGLALVYGWQSRRWQWWLPALVLFLTVKEDAGLYLAALGVALYDRDAPTDLYRRGGFAISGLGLGVAALMIFWIGPHFRSEGSPTFLTFWQEFGTSPVEILLGMATSPWRVVTLILTSGLPLLFASYLFIPALSGRAWIAMAPALLLLGTSANAHMRALNTYYSAPLLPFFYWGLVEGCRTLTALTDSQSQPRRWGAIVCTVGLLVAPLTGGDYLRYRRPLLTEHSALRTFVASHTPKGIVCTQMILMPHLPQHWDLHPLSAACLKRKGAIGLLQPQLSHYPHTAADLASWAATGQPLAGGFVLVDFREK